MKKTYLIPNTEVNELEMQQGILLITSITKEEVEVGADESAVREDKSFWGSSAF